MNNRPSLSGGGLCSILYLHGTLNAWQWSFGDGYTGTQQNPTHIYSHAGMYAVRLTTGTGVYTDTETKTEYVTVIPPSGPRVITYTYDGLYRLTRAAHSTGESFEYAYDAVGNRTAYTRTSGSSAVTQYTYDAANRLTAVNGQAYTWDNNGNPLNDGSKDYVYDQANRLTNVNANGLAWSATYNGDGARLKQTSNGAVTTYTLDLNAGLVQVLTMQDAGGKTAYLYGVTRIGEQQPGGWTYHLSDALGSVRQLADDAAQVTLARGYMPYGEALWSLGEGSSAYGYTGEDWNSYINLVFLRARYMQPGSGVFLSHDPRDGDAERPGSMNGWNYVEDNPTNAIDPAGLQKFTIFASAFIPYKELEFPHVYGYGVIIAPNPIPGLPPIPVPVPLVDPKAKWHGDGRGFSRGGGSTSARVSHRVVIDTDPQAYDPEISSIPFTGETRVRYTLPILGTREARGQAPYPLAGRVTRDPNNLCITTVDMEASVGNPLSPPGTPPIIYKYHLVFDAEQGLLHVSGSHSNFPAHELDIRELSNSIELFTPLSDAPTNANIARPSPGSDPTHTPLDLFAGAVIQVPRPELGIPPGGILIGKHECCHR